MYIIQLPSLLPHLVRICCTVLKVKVLVLQHVHKDLMAKVYFDGLGTRPRPCTGGWGIIASSSTFSEGDPTLKRAKKVHV